MTQPISLHLPAGGVLEESSDGNELQHLMELQHIKDWAVWRGKGRTWASPCNSECTASTCQQAAGDSQGSIPPGVTVLSNRACRGGPGFRARDTRPYPGWPQGGCRSCLQVNSLLCAFAVHLVSCSPVSISCFLFLWLNLASQHGYSWLLILEICPSLKGLGNRKIPWSVFRSWF